MYEFSKKEIRQEFKKTEYGKRTNKWLHISLIVTLVIFAIFIILSFLVFTYDGATLAEKYADYISAVRILYLAVCVACYFDGKRDGAIEQFKVGLKK